MSDIFASRIAGYLERFAHCQKIHTSWLIVSMLCSIRKCAMKSDMDAVTMLAFGLRRSTNIQPEHWKQACVCLLTRKDDRWELADVDRLLRIAGVDKHYRLRQSIAQAVIDEWKLSDPKLNALATWGDVQLKLVPRRGTKLQMSAASH